MFCSRNYIRQIYVFKFGSDYTQISIELKTLKDEIVKSLLGTSDFDTQEIEGKKSMLFQVVDRIELFKERVEIIINIKMDTHKNFPT